MTKRQRGGRGKEECLAARANDGAQTEAATATCNLAHANVTRVRLSAPAGSPNWAALGLGLGVPLSSLRSRLTRTTH